MRLLLICLAAAASAAYAQEFGPDLVMGRFGDVVKAAPLYYHVQLENEKTRVLWAELPAYASTAAYDERQGLLVAITDVHMLYRTTENRVKEITVPAGGTLRVEAESHRVENLGSRPCQFLFVEMKPHPSAAQ